MSGNPVAYQLSHFYMFGYFTLIVSFFIKIKTLCIILNCQNLNKKPHKSGVPVSKQIVNLQMAPWELLNMGIETAINAIEKSGHEICSFCDVPGINPQLWFVIKGDSVPSSLTIRTVAASSTEVMTINDFIHEEKMKKYKHYFLNIELEHPAEYGYEPGKLYRAAPFHIKLKGLEPLSKALETHDFIKLETGQQIWVKEMPEELS